MGEKHSIAEARSHRPPLVREAESGRAVELTRRGEIERYLEDVVAVSFPILDYDHRAADRPALERARLVKSGRTPSFVH